MFLQFAIMGKLFDEITLIFYFINEKHIFFYRPISHLIEYSVRKLLRGDFFYFHRVNDFWKIAHKISANLLALVVLISVLFRDTKCYNELSLTFLFYLAAQYKSTPMSIAKYDLALDEKFV